MPIYANPAVRLVLFIGIVFLMRHVVRPLYRQAVEHWNIFFYVAVMISANFAYYILVSHDIVKTLTQQAPQLLLLIALAVAAYISVFQSLKTLSREYALREDNLKMQGRQELLSVSMSAMEQRLHLQEAAAQQASIVRHDHRHFSGTLLELLQQGQNEKAVHLLEQQLAVVSKAPRRFCENTDVNAAVSYYADLCEQSGAMLHTKLDIPEETHADSLELSMAISNLLENALHACQKLPEAEKRGIQFSARFTGQLLLEIENPYTGEASLDESGYPISKEAGHGIGTKSIIAFVEKQNGQLTYSTESGVFRVRMLL
jgi:sensor histidine kinase regulating citrate/malate metabolism